MKNAIIYLLSIFLHLVLLTDDSKTKEPSSLDVNLETIKSVFQNEAEEILLTYTQSTSEETTSQGEVSSDRTEEPHPVPIINQDHLEIASKE